ncbi:MAG TPA: ATP-binding protein, partial [Candidatus Paceibacterota bacterium]
MAKAAKEKEEKKEKKSSYGAEAITVLEGLEAVRKRPGMYIGTTGPDGLHHLVWEIFDNSRDEAMGGFCDDIEVVLLNDPDQEGGTIVRVVDNGRGIPVDIHKQTKVSALETIMTVLHAGGKFGGEGYKISGGLHGVGASVVNALSTFMRAEVHRDGGAYMQEYARGKKKAAVKQVGKSKLHGTVISFSADPEIFSSLEYDFDRIVSRLREQAYLVKSMRVTIIDARKTAHTLPKAGEVLYMREN